jgi:anti-sigma B factor antagonist
LAPFRVEIENQPRCVVVSVSGELDISTAPELEKALEQAEAGGAGAGAVRAVIDLNGLDFIDSTGVTVLVRSSKRISEAGGEFAVVCRADNIEVNRVLEILGFDEVFTMHETLTEAGCDGPASVT